MLPAKTAGEARVDLRQLRYFAAIVASGSISRASLALNVAQPALSLHIRNMEADLGVPLLFRTPQGVQATEAGLILLRHAKIILGQFDDAEREIRGVATEPSGEVRLGLPSTISQILGVPLVLAARKHCPKVTLRVAEAMSGYVLEWLRTGRVDLGLLYRFVEDRELRSIGLLTEHLALFGPESGGPLPEAKPVPFAALAELPLILPSPGHGLRDLLDERAAELGVPLRTDIDIDAYSAIKALVAKGLGYSVLPVHALQREIEAGQVRSWPFAPALSRTVHLVLPTTRPLSHASRAIEQLCRVTLRDLVRSGEWHAAQMRVTV